MDGTDPFDVKLGAVQVTRSLLRLVWLAGPRLALLLAGLTVVAGVTPVVSIVVGAMLLDRIAQYVLVGSPSGQPSGAVALPGTVVALLVATALVALASQLSTQLRSTTQTLYERRVANRVSLLIAEKAASLDLAFFENPAFHNRLSNASNEAAYRPAMMLGQALSAISSLITAVSAGVVVALWHVWMLPVLIVTAVISFAVSARFARQRARLITGRAGDVVKAQYLGSMLSTDFAAKEIRTYGLGPFFLGRYRHKLERIYDQDRGLARRQSLVTGVMQTLLSVVRPVLLGFIALQVLEGHLPIGGFLLYGQSIGQLEGSLIAAMAMASQLYEGHLFVTNLFAFLAIEPDVETTQASGAGAVPDALQVLGATVPGAPPVARRAPSIEFDRVSFTYPDRLAPALDELSLTISPGEVIALVGDNGAGKSTLVKLLLGLYRPDSGRILLDGRDVTSMSQAEVRAHLSVLFQDYVIYHLSAYENVGLGDVQRLDDRARVLAAARRSGLDRIVGDFPDGYDSMLGRYTERGYELSGGQRQLVGLARTLVRGAPVIVLDEPTAALDVDNESRFFSQILDECRAQGQTVIFISHRFSTVRRADRILVLTAGRLTENGSHEELLRLDGRYATLYRRESDLYREPVPLGGTPDTG